MVIQTKFLKQLQQLELKMTEMGQSCLKGLSLCKHSLYDGDKVLTQEVDELHEEVSTLSRDCVLPYVPRLGKVCQRKR